MRCMMEARAGRNEQLRRGLDRMRAEYLSWRDGSDPPDPTANTG
jgi:hypothetical protein